MATRKEILERLTAGEIDVTQATELLSAVGTAPAEPPAPSQASTPPIPVTPVRRAEPVTGNSGRRWLHVHVSDLANGESRVRVNVPLGLVNFGLKIGARFTNELDDEMVNDVMEVLQDDEFTGTLVEVEDMKDNERVHIYID